MLEQQHGMCCTLSFEHLTHYNQYNTANANVCASELPVYSRHADQKHHHVVQLVLHVQAALDAARRTQAEERDRLSLEAAQARLLCKARARRVSLQHPGFCQTKYMHYFISRAVTASDLRPKPAQHGFHWGSSPAQKFLRDEQVNEVDTELQRLHAKLSEAGHLQQDLTAAAADSALQTQQARDCQAQAEQDRAAMQHQLEVGSCCMVRHRALTIAAASACGIEGSTIADWHPYCARWSSRTLLAQWLEASSSSVLLCIYLDARKPCPSRWPKTVRSKPSTMHSSAARPLHLHSAMQTGRPGALLSWRGRYTTLLPLSCNNVGYSQDPKQSSCMLASLCRHPDCAYAGLW